MDEKLAQLERILANLSQHHEKLLGLMTRQQQVMRQGDHTRLAQIVQQQNAVIRDVAEVEKTRLNLVAELTLIVEPKARQPMRLGELIQELPANWQQRLAPQRQRLIEQMQHVRVQTELVGRSTRTMLKHMQGLIEQISGMVTQSPTYAPRGRALHKPTPVSTFSATA